MKKLEGYHEKKEAICNTNAFPLCHPNPDLHETDVYTFDPEVFKNPTIRAVALVAEGVGLGHITVEGDNA